MAGLSVLLEAQTSSPFPKCPQIISKTNLRSPPSSSSSHFTPHQSPFLEYCFLCRQRLSEGKDIYMYRGDRAFCSEECRCKQIFMDEESVKRDSCSLAAASAAAGARRRRKTRPAVAGGFA